MDVGRGDENVPRPPSNSNRLRSACNETKPVRSPNFLAQNTLAFANFLLGNYEAGLKFATEALRYHPNFSSAHPLGMGTKSRETIYGSSVRAAAARSKEARQCSADARMFDFEIAVSSIESVAQRRRRLRRSPKPEHAFGPKSASLRIGDLHLFARVEIGHPTRERQRRINPDVARAGISAVYAARFRGWLFKLDLQAYAAHSSRGGPASRAQRRTSPRCRIMVGAHAAI